MIKIISSTQLLDNKPDKPQTPSQTRIQKAREFFTKELEELGDDKITKILDSSCIF